MDTLKRKRSFYKNWIDGSVRYSDLDPNGHVNNGAINAFFEDGRVKFRNDYMRGCKSNILTGFVLAKFCVEYLRPLGYPNAVDVGTSLLRVGNSSFTLIQGIFCNEDCIAVAEVVTVFLNEKTQKATKIDDTLRNIFQDMLNERVK